MHCTFGVCAGVQQLGLTITLNKILISKIEKNYHYNDKIDHNKDYMNKYPTLSKSNAHNIRVLTTISTNTRFKFKI